MELRLKLSDFFRKDENVLFAIVFGSCVKGRQHKQTDIDIGINFKGHLEEFAILEYINNHF
jgi:predicted nucleotidyltransferase